MLSNRPFDKDTSYEIWYRNNSVVVVVKSKYNHLPLWDQLHPWCIQWAEWAGKAWTRKLSRFQRITHWRLDSQCCQFSWVSRQRGQWAEMYFKKMIIFAIWSIPEKRTLSGSSRNSPTALIFPTATLCQPHMLIPSELREHFIIF